MDVYKPFTRRGSNAGTARKATPAMAVATPRRHGPGRETPMRCAVAFLQRGHGQGTHRLLHLPGAKFSGSIGLISPDRLRLRQQESPSQHDLVTGCRRAASSRTGRLLSLALYNPTRSAYFPGLAPSPIVRMIVSLTRHFALCPRPGGVVSVLRSGILLGCKAMQTGFSPDRSQYWRESRVSH